MAEWIATANLRFETRPYQEATGFFGGGTVTRYRNVLQQEYQHGETGRMQWRDVPCVPAHPTEATRE